jgi:hypothetical protein
MKAELRESNVLNYFRNYDDGLKYIQTKGFGRRR